VRPHEAAAPPIYYMTSYFRGPPAAAGGSDRPLPVELLLYVVAIPRMKAGPSVRHAVLDKLWPGWPPWRRALNLRRGAGDTAPSPSELAAHACFGRVADHERLALEGLITGCSAPAARTEPPDPDPTESVD
jgi:hypothetical protein